LVKRGFASANESRQWEKTDHAKVKLRPGGGKRCLHGQRLRNRGGTVSETDKKPEQYLKNETNWGNDAPTANPVGEFNGEKVKQCSRALSKRKGYREKRGEHTPPRKKQTRPQRPEEEKKDESPTVNHITPKEATEQRHKKGEYLNTN